LVAAKFNQGHISDSIRNILTLRYDPSQKSLLPHLTWKDFLPKFHVNDISIEKNIKLYLEQNLHQTNTLGIALSGGIDSTLVLHLIKKTFPELKINAFSIRFSNSTDETEIASKIANHFDIDHDVIDLENYLQELPKAIGITQLPFWDIHWYYVAKAASKKSSYLASGDGGDELFGGYTFRYKKFLSLITSDSTPIEKVRAYIQCHERDHVPDQHDIFGKNLSFSWKNYLKFLRPYFENDLSSLDQLFLADYNGKLLYNFSIVNNSINKNFNIKSITPLLNPSFLKSTSHLFNSEKYDIQKNLGKLPLRNILQKSDVYKLLNPKKLGFSVNTQNLWKNYGQKICSYFLSDSEIVKENFVNNDWIQNYLYEDDLDIRYVNKLLGLLACEIWYRIFITKTMKSDEQLIF
jgi:asparagine synthase (glutamine-hydrolysing)